jgi:hypothetical protein
VIYELRVRKLGGKKTMRTSIVIGSILIASAIYPDGFIDKYKTAILIWITIFLFMDFVELVCKT